MSAALFDNALPWLACALICAAIAAAFSAITARSLIAAALAFSVTLALVAAAVLVQGAGDAALGLTLAALALAPFALLGVLLLTGRSVKARSGRRPWATIAAAAVAGVVVLCIVPDVTPAPAPTNAASAAPWLTLLMLVAGAGAFGLIALGERGLFERRARDEAR